jgi:hypothetical protein
MTKHERSTTSCSLCLAGHQPKEAHDGSLIHAVENYRDDKTALVVCADSPTTPPANLQVALKF